MNLINKNLKTPKVSIFCMVYNHEPFIRECLEGFLMQKCNFDYEIVLGEDCSTDNSREIILEYANKFPEKFKLILHDKNVGAAQNQKIVFENCTGKYVAMCEGDDYWTDPLKLQKQVDFLEKNDEYVLSFTKSKEFFENGNNITETIYPNNINNLNFPELLKMSWFIRTATILFRKDKLDLDFIEKIKYGADFFIQLLLINNSKFHFLNEFTSVYRHHAGGISNSNSLVYLERRIQFIENLKMLDKYLDYAFEKAIIKEIKRVKIGIFHFAILNRHFEFFRFIKYYEVFPLIFHLIKRFYTKTIRIFLVFE